MITATQMLESMIHHPEPTRAEASDVANAILDGTSAVMLSGETAMGEYPVQAVQTMDRIARAVEPSLGYRHQIPEATEDPTIGNAMSNAACDLAEALGAAAILVPTFTGRTASAVARLRPRRPIVALTHKQWSVHQMAIEWGVTPIWIPECKDVEDLWNRSMEAATEAGLIETGDTVVITAGTAVNIPGSTNVIKVDVALERIGPALGEGAAHMAARASRRPPTAALMRRWLAVVLVVLIGYAYYHPLRTLARDETRALGPAHGSGAALGGEARASATAEYLRRARMRSHAKRDASGTSARASTSSSSRASRPGAALTLRSTVMESDRATVEAQLGRPPRAFRRVVVRCPSGHPTVTEQSPYDKDGEPFPTMYWLTCPALVAAVSRLEAAGGVERWTRAAAEDPTLAREPRARPRGAA